MMTEPSLYTSTVSYAVRHLKASAGVMITASHNPSIYNGYKVYGADGCQITTEAASAILAQIEKADYFEPAINTEPNVEYISEDVLSAFIGYTRGRFTAIRSIPFSLAAEQCSEIRPSDG